MKKRDKSVLIWIIIIALVIVGFTYAYNNINIQISSNECPNGIIPLEINLTENFDAGAIGNTNFGQEVYSPLTYWVDGQRMNLLDYSKYPLNICHKGQSEGENLNLYYCYGLSYTKSTTPISKDGVIGKTETVSYSIDLVLQKQSETIAIQRRPPLDDIMTTEKLITYKVISSKCVKK